MINPVNAFIETDELEAFVADGGSREVQYDYPERGFRFGYTQHGRWVSYLLPDEEGDASKRERWILELETVCLKQLREAHNAGSVS